MANWIDFTGWEWGKFPKYDVDLSTVEIACAEHGAQVMWDQIVDDWQEGHCLILDSDLTATLVLGDDALFPKVNLVDLIFETALMDLPDDRLPWDDEVDSMQSIVAILRDLADRIELDADAVRSKGTLGPYSEEARERYVANKSKPQP